MGLGKTLQVLTYLAWAIEQGKITAPGGGLDIGPYRPILIIEEPTARLGNDIRLEE